MQNEVSNKVDDRCFCRGIEIVTVIYRNAVDAQTPFDASTLPAPSLRETTKLRIDIHSLGATLDLPRQLLLGLLLGQRLLEVALEIALVHLDLLPPLVDLRLDGRDVGLDLRLVELLGREALGRRQQVLVLLDELAVLLALALLVAAHARLVEGALPARPDLGDARHGLEGRLDEVAVVPHGDVAALRKGQGAVDGHLLAVRAAERLGPGQLARVALHLEVLVAFGFAEPEGLCIVAHWRR
jgi:hypothetical protein